MPSQSTPPRVDDAQILLELTRRVTATLDLQQVLDEAFAALRRLIDFGGGAIQLIQDDVLVAAATDPPATPEAMTVRIPVGQGISGTIAATGEPIYIPDIWKDPRVHPQGKSKGVTTGVRSYFGVPLIVHGRPMGVLQIDAPVEDAFGAQERARLLAFAPAIAAAVQNATIFERERTVARRLRDAESLKRDFLAIASHELRTPITSMGGFGLTLAHHAASLDAETVADIGMRIWRATRRLERVMSEILDLSSMERGAIDVNAVPLHVEWILRTVAHEQSDEDHEITVSIQPGMSKVTADAERLHQIVGNLVGNARKFSPARAPISIEATQSRGKVFVRVCDRGGGVPREIRDRIFEPFVQFETEDTRTRGGLGVGLYIAKMLCEHMGAELSVDDHPGGGACFIVTLRTAK